MVFIAKLWKIKNKFWFLSKSTFIYLLSLDKEEMKILVLNFFDFKCLSSKKYLKGFSE